MTKIIFLIDVSERIQNKLNFCKNLDFALGGDGSYDGKSCGLYHGGKVALATMLYNGSLDSVHLEGLLKRKEIETIFAPAIHGENEHFARQSLIEQGVKVVDYYLPRVHSSSDESTIFRFQAFALAQSI